MRILHPWNRDIRACGMANFADQASTALRLAGAEVTDWNMSPDAIRVRDAQGVSVQFPPDIANYDAMFIGWHPNCNWYTPDQIPPHLVLSAYLHDLPPWTVCPLLPRVDCLITPVPCAGSHRVDLYPVPDWVTALPPPPATFTVGITGLRGDGHAQVHAVCLKYGWPLNASTAQYAQPTTWLSIEDEIRRLARSTVNVCWYSQVRGIAGAPSMCLASGRPLLLNDSPMVQPHHPYAMVSQDLEAALLACAAGQIPQTTAWQDHTWSGIATQWLDAWAQGRRH